MSLHLGESPAIFPRAQTACAFTVSRQDIHREPAVVVSSEIGNAEQSLEKNLKAVQIRVGHTESDLFQADVQQASVMSSTRPPKEITPALCGIDAA